LWYYVIGEGWEFFEKPAKKPVCALLQFQTLYRFTFYGFLPTAVHPIWSVGLKYTDDLKNMIVRLYQNAHFIMVFNTSI